MQQKKNDEESSSSTTTTTTTTATRFSWLSLFLCGVGSSSEKKNMKSGRVPKQMSITRLSFSDFGQSASPKDLSSSVVGSNLHIFTLAELKLVTHNFSNTNLLGEGGFGPVYKGYVDEKLRPGLKRQAVAVKLLDLEGMQGHKEWLAEVIFLGQLRHTHLVKLIGYCYEEEHRLLVYEFMARGSLENHLFQRFVPSLPWNARMRIAVGAAKGLAFLHEAEQPVIYRDFKASNILLDSEYKAKLSDFGLAKDGPLGDETHVSTRVMGTQGYAAPEYIMTGHLSAKSDVFSFGVVLLELLTGRRSVDKNRSGREQSLVEWAKPHLRDHRRINRIIDPCLDGKYSSKAAQTAASLAYQCLSHRPKSRPHISAVVNTIESIQDLDIDIQEAVIVYVATEDGNMLQETNSEKMKAVGPQKENKHLRQHCQRRRGPRYLKSTSYSDTALYRSSPRHRNARI